MGLPPLVKIARYADRRRRAQRRIAAVCSRSYSKRVSLMSLGLQVCVSLIWRMLLIAEVLLPVPGRLTFPTPAFVAVLCTN